MSSPVHALSQLGILTSRIRFVHEDRQRIVRGLEAAQVRLEMAMEDWEDYDGIGTLFEGNQDTTTTTKTTTTTANNHDTWNYYNHTNNERGHWDRNRPILYRPYQNRHFLLLRCLVIDLVVVLVVVVVLPLPLALGLARLCQLYQRSQQFR